MRMTVDASVDIHNDFVVNGFDVYNVNYTCQYVMCR